jgi:hypothetical protein
MGISEKLIYVGLAHSLERAKQIAVYPFHFDVRSAEHRVGSLPP